MQLCKNTLMLKPLGRASLVDLVNALRVRRDADLTKNKGPVSTELNPCPTVIKICYYFESA